MKVKDCNWTRTQNHLALKQTLNHLAKLTKIWRNFLSLGNKEAVTVNPVITVHTLRKKAEIKTVSKLTRIPTERRD